MFGRQNLKKSLRKGGLVNIFIKKCIGKEKLLLVSSESCQKLSGYEKDHESFEEIFLEQCPSSTMGVGTSDCIGVPLFDRMDWKLPNGSTIHISKFWQNRL